MRIEPIEDGDLPELLRFVAAQSSSPESHVAYVSGSPEEVGDEFRTLSFAHSRVAREGDRIAGFLGAELDLELKRAWLWGPFVEHPAWNLLADRLYADVAASLPADIHEHELAFDTRNFRGCEFARRHGLRPWNAGTEALVLVRGGLKDTAPDGDRLRIGVVIEPLPERFREAVRDLHDRTFPGTYYSGKQIVEKAGETDRVFVAADDDAFLGYAYLAIENAQREGFLHFLATEEAARRRGVGRALVTHAARWAFSFPEVERVALSVDIGNEAIRLYRRLGFVRERSLRGFRKAFPRVRVRGTSEA